MHCGCTLLCKKCWEMVFRGHQSSFSLPGHLAWFQNGGVLQSLTERTQLFSKLFHEPTNSWLTLSACASSLSVAHTAIIISIATVWSTHQPNMDYFPLTAPTWTFSYEVHTWPWTCMINPLCICLFVVISYTQLISNLIHYLPCDSHTVSP